MLSTPARSSVLRIAARSGNRRILCVSHRSGPRSSSEQAADYVIAHGNAVLAHAVVRARSKARQPVWNKAYDALVGLYFAEATPQM